MRFAVFYAPEPESPLSNAAARWLGRDPWTGRSVPQPGLPRLVELTSAPRRYGFHATLKPPFMLPPELSEYELRAAVAALASSLRAVRIDALHVATDAGFVAFVPQNASPAAASLAFACVEGLEAFRAPMCADELHRRRTAGLTARQEQLLQSWGYPYVADEFRFHLTLSNAAGKDDLEQLAAAANLHFAAFLGRPLLVDSLSLFCEPAPGEPFRALARFPIPANLPLLEESK